MYIYFKKFQNFGGHGPPTLIHASAHCWFFFKLGFLISTLLFLWTLIRTTTSTTTRADWAREGRRSDRVRQHPVEWLCDGITMCRRIKWRGSTPKLKTLFFFFFLIFHLFFSFLFLYFFVFAIWKDPVRLKTSYHIINGADLKLLSHNLSVILLNGLYIFKFQMQNKIKLLRLMGNVCCLCS